MNWYLHSKFKLACSEETIGYDTMKINGYWKVPGRMVYCERLRDCVVQTLYCHIWLRVFRRAMPSIGARAD